MNKQKHLRIRINEQQLKNLIKVISKHDYSSKSEFVRQAINEKIQKTEKNGLQRTQRPTK
jgi:metal-responsive CopG/Arc/MetJ family transcriptional regulator